MKTSLVTGNLVRFEVQSVCGELHKILKNGSLPSVSRVFAPCMLFDDTKPSIFVFCSVSRLLFFDKREIPVQLGRRVEEKSFMGMAVDMSPTQHDSLQYLTYLLF